MEEAAMEIFKPVMESSVILGSHYAKGCGRDVVLAEDIRMGLMYAARNVVGKQVGSLFPEIYEEGESDSDESWETVSETEYVWTRYEGTDNDMCIKMNECADTWAEWEPETPAERALKNAVDKQLENSR
jgi:hypothetical protein